MSDKFAQLIKLRDELRAAVIAKGIHVDDVTIPEPAVPLVRVKIPGTTYTVNTHVADFNAFHSEKMDIRYRVISEGVNYTTPSLDSAIGTIMNTLESLKSKMSELAHSAMLVEIEKRRGSVKTKRQESKQDEFVHVEHSDAEVKTEAKVNVKAEVKTETKVDVKAEVKPEVKTEVKPEVASVTVVKRADNVTVITGTAAAAGMAIAAATTVAAIVPVTVTAGSRYVTVSSPQLYQALTQSGNCATITYNLDALPGTVHLTITAGGVPDTAEQKFMDKFRQYTKASQSTKALRQVCEKYLELEKTIDNDQKTLKCSALLGGSATLEPAEFEKIARRLVENIAQKNAMATDAEAAIAAIEECANLRKQLVDMIDSYGG